MRPYAGRSETAQKVVTRWFIFCAASFMTLGGYIFLSVMYWNPPSTPAHLDAYLMILLSAVLAGVCWLLAWGFRTNRITTTWADDDEGGDDHA